MSSEFLLIRHTDVTQAFAAANRIRSMRPRGKFEDSSNLLNVRSSDGGEIEAQGVKIELQNISFQYPTRNVPVLNGLNMVVGILLPNDNRH